LAIIANSDGPHRLDVAIGQRIRERRRAVGMSQQTLAERVGVTFQQVQKYERGSNRISFSRLIEIADALSCRLNDLADGLDSKHASDELRHLNALLAEDGALELLEAYRRVRGKPLRRALLAHTRALGDLDKPPKP
jgi:transcriptional regulator with XRE-family HTH domain